MDAREIETWRMCIDIVRRFHDPQEPSPADVLASAVEGLQAEMERLTRDRDELKQQFLASSCACGSQCCAGECLDDARKENEVLRQGIELYEDCLREADKSGELRAWERRCREDK